jgi:hypothetical protein
MLSDDSITKKLSKAASAVGSEAEFKFNCVDLIHKQERNRNCESSMFSPHYELYIIFEGLNYQLLIIRKNPLGYIN